MRLVRKIEAAQRACCDVSSPLEDAWGDISEDLSRGPRDLREMRDNYEHWRDAASEAAEKKDDAVAELLALLRRQMP